MLQITENSECLLEKTAVTIGKFDGIHRGHRKLLERILSEKENGYRACVVSFLAEPAKQHRVIYTREEKYALCRLLGVDILAEYTLNEAFRTLSAEQFVAEILCKGLRAEIVVVGEDFRFGKNRKGDVAFLRALEKKYGYRTICIPQVEIEGEPVSSTRIRTLLSEGAVKEAGELLGQPYFVQGEVMHGKKLGRTLGFPTINLLPPEEKLLPAYGVYATRTKLGEMWYRGVTNVGVRPTVKDEKQVSVETFLKDYTGHLYGQTLTTEFLSFLRPEQKFANVEELKRAIGKDIDAETKVFLKNA